MIGAATLAGLPEGADVDRARPMQVKGKSQPVQAYVLHGLARPAVRRAAGGYTRAWAVDGESLSTRAARVSRFARRHAGACDRATRSARQSRPIRSSCTG